MRLTLGTALLLVVVGCGRTDAKHDSPEFVAESQQRIAETVHWNDARIIGFIRAASGVLAGDGDAAEHRSQNGSLSAFGKRLTAGQRSLSLRADSVARQLGISPAPPERETFLDAHRQTAQALLQLSGAAFDQRLVAHVTSALERAAEQLDTVAGSGGSDQVRLLLHAARDTLRAELETARRLNSSTEATSRDATPPRAAPSHEDVRRA